MTIGAFIVYVAQSDAYMWRFVEHGEMWAYVDDEDNEDEYHYGVSGTYIHIFSSRRVER